jgi:hypothetical protein
MYLGCRRCWGTGSFERFIEDEVEAVLIEFEPNNGRRQTVKKNIVKIVVSASAMLACGSPVVISGTGQP